MTTRNRRDLFIQISGNIDPLKAATTAGKSVLNQFGTAAIDVAAEVEKALGTIGQNAPAQAKLLERSYEKTFSAIRANARAALGANSGAGAIEVLNAGGARQAAEAAEREAGALRLVANAAALNDAAATDNAAANRLLALTTEVAAREAEEHALALRGQADALSGVEARLESVSGAQRRQVAVTGQARAGMQQLSFQLGDVATQYAANTPLTVIFAQQIGQVTQAIGLMTTNTKGFLGFIGGPWGIALSSALVVLTPLVAKLFEESEASKAAEKATKDHAKAIEALIAAQGKAVLSTEAKLRQDFKDLEVERLKELQVRKTTAALLEQTKAKLDDARARETDPTLAGEGGFNPGTAAATLLAGEIAALQAKISANDKRIGELTTASNQAAGQFVKSIVEANSTPEGRIRRRYQELEDAAQLEVQRSRDTAKYARTLTELNQARQAELKVVQEANRRPRRTPEPSLPKVTTGDVGAALKSAFGGTITRGTSTPAQNRAAGGAANSLHLTGQAIDFVPAGGVKSISKAEVRALLERTVPGIDIKELLGPGDKDHDDHFHVGFGRRRLGADQVARRGAGAERTVEAERQREIAEDIRFADEERQLRGRLLDLQAKSAANEAQRVELVEADIAAEAQAYAIRIGLVQSAGKLSEAEATRLLALSEEVRQQKLRNLKIESAARIFERQVDVQRRSGDADIQLLRLQLDLAKTTAERKRIAGDLLAAEQRQRRLALVAIRDNPNSTAEQIGDANVELARSGLTDRLEREQLDQQDQSPTDAYRDRLQKAIGDIDEAFEQVEARGLEALEDGLVGIISGTESVGSAFKRMADQIIADLIRIGVQKLILAAIGGEEGSAPGGGGGAGLVQGAGSIFDMIFRGTKIPGFAKGGRPPVGRLSIVGEEGPELFIADSAGTIIPNDVLAGTALPRVPQNMGRGAGVSISMPISLHAPGADPAALARLQSEIRQLQRDLPGTIVGVMDDARSRGFA